MGEEKNKLNIVQKETSPEVPTAPHAAPEVAVEVETFDPVRPRGIGSAFTLPEFLGNRGARRNTQQNEPRPSDPSLDDDPGVRAAAKPHTMAFRDS